MVLSRWDRQDIAMCSFPLQGTTCSHSLSPQQTQASLTEKWAVRTSPAPYPWQSPASEAVYQEKLAVFNSPSSQQSCPNTPLEGPTLESPLPPAPSEREQLLVQESLSVDEGASASTGHKKLHISVPGVLSLKDRQTEVSKWPSIWKIVSGNCG